MHDLLKLNDIFITHLVFMSVLSLPLPSSHVDEVEPAECLWQAGYDGSVPLGIVIQLEQGGGHQFVVARHGEVSLLV